MAARTAARVGRGGRARTPVEPPNDPQAERGDEPEGGPGDEADSGERGEAEASPASPGRGRRGARATRTVSPPWPRTRAAVARAQGSATTSTGAARAGAPAEHERPPSAEQQVGAEEDLEERHRGGLERGESQVAAGPPRPRSATRRRARRGRATSAGHDRGWRTTSDRRRLPRSRSAHQWACGLAAKTNEKSVSRSVQGASATAAGRAAEAGGDGAQREDEARAPRGSRRGG